MFSGLEDKLEKYIEGFFKNKFSTGARVQPTDIAKKLFRSMKDKRRVSVANIYVPNEYFVYLHPTDYETIVPMAPALSSELVDYLIQKAKEKNFTLVARPTIQFAELDSIKSGDILIECKYGQAEPEEVRDIWQKAVDESKYEQIENTMNFEPIRDTAPIPKIKSAISASLFVEEGPDTGREFLLGDYRVVMGRRDSCDIVLLDSSISRRHAQLEPAGGRYWLTDLGSTNGTYLNGLLVEKVELTSGDVISLGSTVLIFKEF
ncbi:DUF3662 and FHA domain-containing protein [Desulforamulus aquiferis]|uniref:DUF3662 and FHA domain-containing protein n=2 Tax=Desulforamulus aquiferis TaxID=1397668 RepID=A0AAW7Z8U8_9FIRM|nr:DUF3662 and FHA domain-containing protein [Desulforamulus aquiferis]